MPESRKQTDVHLIQPMDTSLFAVDQNVNKLILYIYFIILEVGLQMRTKRVQKKKLQTAFDL